MQVLIFCFEHELLELNIFFLIKMEDNNYFNLEKIETKFKNYTFSTSAWVTSGKN